MLRSVLIENVALPQIRISNPYIGRKYIHGIWIKPYIMVIIMERRRYGAVMFSISVSEQLCCGDKFLGLFLALLSISVKKRKMSMSQVGALDCSSENNTNTYLWILPSYISILSICGPSHDPWVYQIVRDHRVSVGTPIALVTKSAGKRSDSWLVQSAVVKDLAEPEGASKRYSAVRARGQSVLFFLLYSILVDLGSSVY